MAATNSIIYVAHDHQGDGGCTLIGERLSRRIGRISIARRVLKRVKRRVPAAYLMQVTVF